VCEGVTTDTTRCRNSTLGTGGTLNTVFWCSADNIPHINDQCDDGACYELALSGANCLESFGCMSYSNALGMFTNLISAPSVSEEENSCRGYLQDDIYSHRCYYDYSDTSVDACFNCENLTSCFDYRSEDACEVDIQTCGTSGRIGDANNCYWQDTVSFGEFGKGYCIDPDAKDTNDTSRCSLCNSSNDPFFNLGCQDSLCRSFGYCYGGGESCAACAPEPKCEDLKTMDACIGISQTNFQITKSGVWQNCPSSPAFTYSDSSCHLQRCSWNAAASQCVKDANADNDPDCGANTVCRKDQSPPVVGIYFPEKINNNSAYINISLEDTASSKKYFYYCFSNGAACCPTNELKNEAETNASVSFTLPLKDETLIPRVVEGSNTLFYYSIDGYGDKKGVISPVENISFVVDTIAPRLTSFVVNGTNNRACSNNSGRWVCPSNSLYIKVLIDDDATCTFDLLPSSYASRTPMVSQMTGNTFEMQFDGLPDLWYTFTGNCHDAFDNELSFTKTIVVDFITAIQSANPFQQTVRLGPQTLSVITSDDGNCTYQRVDKAGQLISPPRLNDLLTIGGNNNEYYQPVYNPSTRALSYTSESSIGAGGPFTGNVQRLMVFSRVLSAQELAGEPQNTQNTSLLASFDFSQSLIEKISMAGPLVQQGMAISNGAVFTNMSKLAFTSPFPGRVMPSQGSVVIEFTPDFAFADGLAHTILDLSHNDKYFLVFKGSDDRFYSAYEDLNDHDFVLSLVQSDFIDWTSEQHVAFSWDIGARTLSYNTGSRSGTRTFEGSLVSLGEEPPSRLETAVQFNPGISNPDTLGSGIKDPSCSLSSQSCPYTYNATIPEASLTSDTYYYFVNCSTVGDSALLSFSVDEIPPVTTPKVDGSPLANNSLFGAPVTIDLECNDPLIDDPFEPSGAAGCEETYSCVRQGIGCDPNESVASRTITEDSYLCYRSNDTKGNREQTSCLYILIDTISPVVTISSPADGSITNDSSFQLTGVVSDSSVANLTMEVRVFGQDTGEEGVQEYPIMSGSGAFSIAAAPPLLNLFNGTNVIQVTGIDGAGNNASASIRVYYDVFPPDLSLPDVAGGTIIEYGNNISFSTIVNDTRFTSQENLSVWFTLPVGNAIFAGDMDHNETLYNHTLQMAPECEEDGSCPVPVGNYTLTVFAKDKFGNLQSSNMTIYVTDSMAPEMNITIYDNESDGEFYDPTNITTIKNDPIQQFIRLPYYVEVNASEPLGSIQNITISVQGKPPTSITQYSFLQGGRIIHAIFTIPDIYRDMYANATLTLNVKDHNNVSGTASFQFLIDTQGPGGLYYAPSFNIWDPESYHLVYPEKVKVHAGYYYTNESMLYLTGMSDSEGITVRMKQESGGYKGSDWYNYSFPAYAEELANELGRGTPSAPALVGAAELRYTSFISSPPSFMYMGFSDLSSSFYPLRRDFGKYNTFYNITNILQDQGLTYVSISPALQQNYTDAVRSTISTVFYDKPAPSTWWMFQANLQEGENNFTAMSQDQLGNPAIPAMMQVFYDNKTPFVPSFVYPQNGYAINDNRTVITATIRDDPMSSGIDIVALDLQGNNTSFYTENCSVEINHFVRSGSLDGTVTCDLFSLMDTELENGDYNATLILVDNAGNKGERTINFSVQTGVPGNPVFSLITLIGSTLSQIINPFDINDDSELFTEFTNNTQTPLSFQLYFFREADIDLTNVELRPNLASIECTKQSSNISFNCTLSDPIAEGSYLVRFSARRMYHENETTFGPRIDREYPLIVDATQPEVNLTGESTVRANTLFDAAVEVGGEQKKVKLEVLNISDPLTSPWKENVVMPAAGALFTGLPISSLNSGYYDITARVADQAGNRRIANLSIYVDNQVPMVANISSLSHPSQEQWYRQSLVTMQWNVSDDHALAGTKFIFSNNPDTLPGMNAANDTNGSFIPAAGQNATVNTTLNIDQLVPLGYGTIYFRARSQDQAGHWSAPSEPFVIKIDQLPPAVILRVPQSNITNNEFQQIVFELDGTVSPVDESSIQLVIDGRPITISPITASYNETTHYLTFTPNQSLLAGYLRDEPHNVYAILSFMDQAGNALRFDNNNRPIFTIDLNATVIQSIKLATARNGPFFPSEGVSSLGIYGFNSTFDYLAVSFNEPLASLDSLIVSKDGASLCDDLVDASGINPLIPPNKTFVCEHFHEGTGTYAIDAIVSTNTSDDYTLHAEFTIDVDPPQIALVAPGQDAQNLPQVTWFVWNVSDNFINRAEVTCSLFINDSEVYTHASRGKVWERERSLAGNSSWYVSCYDGAVPANAANSSIWNFTVDFIPPTMNGTVYEERDNATGEFSVPVQVLTIRTDPSAPIFPLPYYIRVNASEPLSDVNMTFRVSGGQPVPLNVTLDGPYPWAKVPIDFSYRNMDANATIAIAAKDAAGVVGSGLIQIHIDTLAPDAPRFVPSLNSPVDRYDQHYPGKGRWYQEVPDTFFTNESSLYITGFSNEGDLDVSLVSPLALNIFVQSQVTFKGNAEATQAALAGSSSILINAYRNGSFVQFDADLREEYGSFGKYYQVVSIAQAGSRYNLTIQPPLERSVADGASVSFYEGSAPAEWFGFDVALQEGNNDITLNAADSQGNPSPTRAASIFLDNNAPSISFTYPLDGYVINTNMTNMTNMTIAYADSIPSSGIRNVAAALTGPSGSIGISCSNASSGFVLGGRIDGYLSCAPLSLLVPGVYDLSAWTNDYAGSNVTGRMNFTVSNDVPYDPDFYLVNAALERIENSFDVNHPNEPFTEFTNSTEAVSFALEFLYENNVSVTSVWLVPDAATIACSQHNGTVSYCNLSQGLAEGTYKVVFTAARILSNGSFGPEIQREYTIVEDTTSPSPIINVSALASGSGVFPFQIMFDEPYMVIIEDLLFEGGSVVQNFPGGIFISPAFFEEHLPTVPSQDYNLTAVVHDQAGQEGIAIASVHIDAQAPLITNLSSLSHPDQTLFYNNSSVTLSWHGSDDSQIFGYKYLFSTDQGDVPTTMPFSDEKGIFNETSAQDMEVTYDLSTLLPEGFGTIYASVRAVDAVGNWGPVKNFVVNIDLVPPVLQNMIPSPGTTARSQAPQITIRMDGTGSRINESSIRMKIDGIAVSPAFNLETQTITYQPTQSLMEGREPSDNRINILLNVTDKAGNKVVLGTEGSLSFFIDGNATQIEKVQLARNQGGVYVPPAGLEIDTPYSYNASYNYLKVVFNEPIEMNDFEVIREGSSTDLCTTKRSTVDLPDFPDPPRTAYLCSGFNDGDAEYAVHASVSNDHGTYSLVQPFTLDANPPIVTLISPSNNSRVRPLTTFTWQVADFMIRRNVLSCALYVNGVPMAAMEQASSSFIKTVFLPADAEDWFVECADPAGNTGSSETRSVIVNMTYVPDITIFYPSEGQTFITDSTIINGTALTYRADDTNTIDDVLTAGTNVTVQETFNGEVVSANSTIVDESGFFELPLSLGSTPGDDGNYTIDVFATNIVGLQGSFSLTIRKDRFTPPTIRLIFPKNYPDLPLTGYTNVSEFNITIETNKPSSCRLIPQTTAIPEQMMASNNISHSLNRSVPAQGAYNYQVVCNDSLNNTNTSNVIIIYDRQAPQILGFEMVPNPVYHLTGDYMTAISVATNEQTFCEAEVNEYAKAFNKPFVFEDNSTSAHLQYLLRAFFNPLRDDELAGEYEVTLLCRDAAGNAAPAMATTLAITPDLQVRITEHNLPFNDEDPLYINDQNITLNITTNIQASCNVTQLYQGLLGWILNLLAPKYPMLTVNNYTHILQLPFSNAFFEDGGEYHYRITCEAVSVDSIINREAYLLYDSTPPTITINPLPSLVNHSSLNVSGIISDDTQRVTIEVIGMGVREYPILITQRGSFSTSILLDEGDNEIKATAIDHAGNQGVREAWVSFVTQGPTITMIYPEDGQTLRGLSSSVIAQVQGKNGASIDKARSSIHLSNENGEIMGSISKIGTDNNVNISWDNITPLLDAPGTYEFTVDVTAADQFGNENQQSSSFFISDEQPIITVTSHNSSEVIRTMAPIIRGTIQSAGQMLENFTLTYNGANFNAGFKDRVNMTTFGHPDERNINQEETWQFPASNVIITLNETLRDDRYEFTIYLPLSGEGNNPLRLSARTTLGNENQRDILLIADLTPPTPTNVNVSGRQFHSFIGPAPNEDLIFLEGDEPPCDNICTVNEFCLSDCLVLRNIGNNRYTPPTAVSVASGTNFSIMYGSTYKVTVYPFQSTYLLDPALNDLLNQNGNPEETEDHYFFVQGDTSLAFWWSVVAEKYQLVVIEDLSGGQMPPAGIADVYIGKFQPHDPQQ